MKTILITGGLGHIGSKFLHSIKPGDYDEVRILDNMSTQRFYSLFKLPKNVNFNFIEEDLLDTDIMTITKNVDVVVHLAAITDAQSSFKRVDEINQVNYNGTIRIAKGCIKNGAKLFFPSTTSVYGSKSKLVNEDCPINELNPQSPYAKDKLKTELMLKKMGSESDLKYVISRLGTIFGRSIGMRFHTAVNKFCWQASFGQKLTVWETAMYQKRPYLGVDDAVNAIKFIINQDLFNNQIYNIVSSNHTVRDIIKFIKTIIPEVQISFVNTEIMNQLSYEVEAKKIQKLGFHASQDIYNGVKEVIELIKIQKKY